MIYDRGSIRLKNYDYSSAGKYFVTICTKGYKNLFGHVEKGKMHVNDYGKVVTQCWVDVVGCHSHIHIGQFVVMPNHMHGIIVFDESVGAIHESPVQMSICQRRKMGLSKVVERFKMISSKKINILRQSPGAAVWHRNYYENIIRKEKDLERIQEYIRNNPLNWQNDKYHI